MPLHIKLICVATLVLSNLGLGAFAQNMSADDILNRMKSQRTRTLGYASASDQENTEGASAISRNGDLIDLEIYFEFDSAILKLESQTQLNALCEAILADNSEGRYRIIGHTDAKGKTAYNQYLSLKRANEVVRYMARDCRISMDRLEAFGQGERQPKNADDPNASENRRVAVQVLQ